MFLTHRWAMFRSFYLCVNLFKFIQKENDENSEISVNQRDCQLESNQAKYRNRSDDRLATTHVIRIEKTDV